MTDETDAVTIQPAKPFTPITVTPGWFRWSLGKRLRKKTGSQWHGRVVGFYCTVQTSEGYAIESEREPGSVQIYPASALEELGDD